MIVQIDPLLADTIRHASRKSYPYECCGLLTGEAHDDTIIITGVHPSENVTTNDPARSFEVDPKLRFDLMRLVEAMDDQTKIIGHYHSHPDNPAKPSKTDLSMAYEVEFIWLICASTETGAHDIGAFRPKSDQSDFDTLQVMID